MKRTTCSPRGRWRWQAVPLARLALAALLAAALLPGSCLHADKGDGRLDANVLKKAKKATVYLRVTLADGNVVQGSGFFGGEPGLVLTNAHVLGMLRPESPRPQKVEIVVNSGEKDEITLPGIVLGVDPNSDLGLIRPRTKDVKALPPPLIVDEKKELQETDPVFIFGFPFGTGLGKNVTVAKSAVSSLRKGAVGGVQKIQVNGGMHPGNSGGPVIAESGEVVGVAVSGIKNTAINFAVPARSISLFLMGRFRNYVFEPVYKDGTAVKSHTRTTMSDPLRRIREVHYETWIGDVNPNREKTTEQPGTMKPGDTEHVKCPLVYKDGVGEGDLTFPSPPPAKKAYWAQLVWTSSIGKFAFRTPAMLPFQPPIEPKPVTLKRQPQLGATHTWGLNSTSTFKIRDQDGADHALAVNLKTLVQATSAAKADRTAVPTTLKFNDLVVSATVDKEVVGATKDDPEFTKQVALVTASLRENADGSFDKLAFDFRKVPKAAQDDWEAFSDQVLASLDAVSTAVPSGELSPGKTVKVQRPLGILFLGTRLPVLAELEYEYLGTRARGKREEAVFNVKGELKSIIARLNLSGKVTGAAWVDVATGHVQMASSKIDMDFEFSYKKRPAKAGGTLEVRLNRPLDR